MIKESYMMVDAVAQKDNFFTRMDARIKVILCVITVAAILSVPGYILPLGVFFLSLVAMFLIRTPVKLVIGRLLPPLALGSFVFLFMLFFQGGLEWFVLNIAGFKVIGYEEGFYHGMTILTRITGSISILLFLSVTTPIHELGYALIWMRCPRTLVEILLLTYRYLFVLWDEGSRIKQAQTLRLGYPSFNNVSGWKMSIKSTITLMGMVFIRAYDRAESTFSAMQVRAYNGNISARSYKSWNKANTHCLVSGLIMIVFLITVSV